jgi:tetratricopeptide (TPR) repeat protein
MEIQGKSEKSRVCCGRRGAFHPGWVLAIIVALVIAFPVVQLGFRFVKHLLGLDQFAASDRAFERLEAGDLEGALKWANRAISFDAKYYSGYTARAYAYEAKGDYAGAVSDYSTAIRLEAELANRSSDPTGLLWCRARVYEKMGDVDSAVADYHAAGVPKDAGLVGSFISIRRWHPGMRWEPGSHYASRHPAECLASVEELIKVFDEAIKRHPDDKGFQTDRSNLLSCKEQLSQMIKKKIAIK